MKQLFIFSLPRAGSTLLQRVLMGHEKIASVSEPWILLPQVYSLRNEGHLSEYSSRLSSQGINNLINKLPNKRDDYYESLGGFIKDIHCKLSSGEEYFLDKTPRYYYIIDEIKSIFPDSKFIFLFRSPEQVYSSMLKTWSNNRLTPFLGSYYDLTVGLQKLSEGYQRHERDSIGVNYEEFVSNPERELKRILDYLQLSYDSSILESFIKQDVKSSLGDPTGSIKYSQISKESLGKWKDNIDTYVKKKVVSRTIRKIDEKSLSLQGYNREEIINSINGLKINYSLREFRDLSDYVSNYFVRKFHLNILMSESFGWTKRKFFS
ncbi:sulfotransferase [Mangrovimonas sp. CR14]|uniref:sulfotransferase family protein n=1 Tax=Mangrovimonas sp. CR14 TaxID=2706120 RepID=UPI00141FA17F|nr:sulfotransferase [Mangrovimonas sp. CR14]NIK90868.1 sulfotransferase [Mangrovimonas sp. CR14]